MTTTTCGSHACGCGGNGLLGSGHPSRTHQRDLHHTARRRTALPNCCADTAELLRQRAARGLLARDERPAWTKRHEHRRYAGHPNGWSARCRCRALRGRACRRYHAALRCTWRGRAPAPAPACIMTTPGIDCEATAPARRAMLLDLRFAPTTAAMRCTEPRANGPTAQRPAGRRAGLAPGADCAPSSRAKSSARPSRESCPAWCTALRYTWSRCRRRPRRALKRIEPPAGYYFACVNLLRQYLQLLAGAAEVEGVQHGRRRHPSGAIGRCAVLPGKNFMPRRLPAAAPLPSGRLSRYREQFRPSWTGRLVFMSILRALPAHGGPGDCSWCATAWAPSMPPHGSSITITARLTASGSLMLSLGPH